MPGYFETDFDPKIIGVCEPSGYRTDYFLFSWHETGSQADPNTYSFYIVPVDAMKPLASGLRRKLPLSVLTDGGPGISFMDLPDALNKVADEFVLA